MDTAFGAASPIHHSPIDVPDTANNADEGDITQVQREAANEHVQQTAEGDITQVQMEAANEHVEQAAEGDSTQVQREAANEDVQQATEWAIVHYTPNISHPPNQPTDAKDSGDSDVECLDIVSASPLQMVLTSDVGKPPNAPPIPPQRSFPTTSSSAPDYTSAPERPQPLFIPVNLPNIRTPGRSTASRSKATYTRSKKKKK